MFPLLVGHCCGRTSILSLIAEQLLTLVQTAWDYGRKQAREGGGEVVLRGEEIRISEH